MYEYAATVDRVVDADTYVMVVDLGWHVSIEGNVRLLGVDCPERGTDAGAAAAAFVTDLFATAQRITVTTVRREPSRSFARYLARVDVDGADLAQLLVDAGHGVAYP